LQAACKGTVVGQLEVLPEILGKFRQSEPPRPPDSRDTLRRMWFRSRLAVLSLLGVLGGCSLVLDFDATSSQPDTSGAAFCGKHTQAPTEFCDDFDGEALGMKWPLVEEMNGTARADATAFTSSPNSLLSTAAGVMPNSRVRGVGIITFSKLKDRSIGLRISFNMRVEQFDATPGAKNIAFDFLYGPNADFNQIVLNLVSTGSAVSVQVAENAQKVGDTTSQYQQYGPFTIKPTVGQWMKVEMDIDINQPVGLGNKLSVRLDGQNAVETQLAIPLKGDTPRMELGLGWVDATAATQPWAVRYDDFLVDSIGL
jgi:hypothetical protein